MFDIGSFEMRVTTSICDGSIQNMETESALQPMLKVKEVAELLRVHRNTVRRWSDNGLIKSYRITPRGDRRFRQKDIAQFLNDFDTQ
jgi:excisionase family DNA binding protein